MLYKCYISTKYATLVWSREIHMMLNSLLLALFVCLLCFAFLVLSNVLDLIVKIISKEAVSVLITHCDVHHCAAHHLFGERGVRSFSKRAKCKGRQERHKK